MTIVSNKFDHIISLGGHCEIVHHVRRYFKIEKASIFDWFVTPTASLVDMLENNFSDMFLPSNMRIIFDGTAVMCDRYGTVHFHDFDTAQAEGKYVPDLVTQGCPDNITKFSFLADRFRSLSGRVLFIRLDEGTVYGGDRNGDFNDDLFARFIKVIEQILPNINYQVLLLRGNYRCDHPKIHYDIVDTYNETKLFGSERGWDELFQRQEITLA